MKEGVDAGTQVPVQAAAGIHGTRVPVRAAAGIQYLPEIYKYECYYVNL